MISSRTGSRSRATTPLGAAREREHGQILVLFAFVLIALLLVSALAVDYGGWLLARRSYQNASDEAAIAGAYLLTSDISNPCASGGSKNHCAREAAWTSLQAHLGLDFGGLSATVMADSIGDVAYTEKGYSIWVASPPSDAGAAYPGFASSLKTIFVRVDRIQGAGLSRIIQAAPTVGAWATAGRIPQNFAILTLCGPPTCKPPNGEDLKVNGTGSSLILLSGDIGSNSFAKTAGNDAAIALSEQGGSLAYMHYPAQCTVSSISCQLVGWDEATSSRTTRKSALALPQVVDPQYPPPAFNTTATPWQCRPYGTGAAISAIPSDVNVAGGDLSLVAARQPAVEQPVVLGAPTKISGKVTDSSTGSNLTGATVHIVSGPGVPPGYADQITPSNGTYTFTVTTGGDFTVQASLANYATLSYTVTVPTGGTYTLNFALQPNPGTISGVVSGAPSTVTLTLDTGQTTTTDLAGNYTFTGVMPGSRVVTPTPPGGYISTPASRTVTVAPGGTVAGVNFAISAVPTGTVSGTVTDATTNLPIPGVTVTITQGAGSGKSATTNSSGVYTINSVNTGANQRVTATLAGYTNAVSGNFTVSNGAVTTVNLQMWPARCGTSNATYGRWDCGNPSGNNCPAVDPTGTGANVSCSAFNNTNRIRPGTYERITISSNQCAWIDPLGAPTGLGVGQSPGIVYVTDEINIGSNAFLFGDGVTIFLAPGAQVTVNNSGGFVLNFKGITGTFANTWRTYTHIGGTGVTACAGDADGIADLRKGAWTTKNRYVWDTSVNPPCYHDEPIDPAEIGMTWFMRGAPTIPHRFDLSGLMGFLFDGVLYGPKDDIGLGGQGAQAAAGQIVAWTLTYGGSTDIIQRYSGLQVDGPPYLIEPYIGE